MLFPLIAAINLFMALMAFVSHVHKVTIAGVNADMIGAVNAPIEFFNVAEALAISDIFPLNSEEYFAMFCIPSVNAFDMV